MTVLVLGHLPDDVEWVTAALRSVGASVAETVPPGGGAAVVVHRSPASVLRRLLARGGRTPEVGAALWERRSREILRAAEGCPALVVRPSADPLGALGTLASFLSDHGLAATVGDGAAPPAEAPGPWHPSREQARLAAVLDALVGSHRALAVGDLGPETPTTDALVAADRCFEQERGRLERCLATAVGAVEGLSAAGSPATPAFGLRAGAHAGNDSEGYHRWIARHEPRGGGADDRQPASGPVISVVVPVCGPDVALLERCVASVAAQTHPGWELWVALAPGDPAVTAVLERWAGRDPRVRVVQAPAGGDPALAAGAGAAHAAGELVTFVDQHDVLAPGALAAVAEAVGDDPGADVVYTDEDHIDGDGVRSRPSFKPDWSPDLLLSTMYIGRLLAVRRSLFHAVGGLRPGLGDATWYDLALRATEAARSVAHAPVVAYHRGSVAGGAGGASHASRAEATVLAWALARRGADATVERGRTEGSFRVRYRARSDPLVSVVVPFRDGAGLLRRCVDSVLASGYERVELVLVDNDSWEPETAALRRLLERDQRCRVVDDRRPFSWAAINNAAVEHARGDLVLFLNSDVEGRAPGWLAAMVEHAQRPEVGAVGARLLYPDGRVQHAGVVMGLGGGAAWHAFCLLPGDDPGYLGHAQMVRNYSAVTGAAMMVRTELFRELGGFDERFAVCFNDVDFCLRLRQAGYLVVSTPFAELVHHESSARGLAVDGRDVAEITRRWGPLIRRDPYFNPNLDPRRAELALPR